jgi:predicted O-methyltransferase YrrM
LHTHKNTFPSIDNVGEIIPEYQPTFDFPEKYIDSFHRTLGTSALKKGMLQLKDRSWFGSNIQGWLRPEDALKLYELAYYVRGDILELGSYHGLSTTILSRANLNSPNPKHLFTVDLSSTCIAKTEGHLRAGGLLEHTTTICSDALATVKKFISDGKTFDFVFIDHSHAYQSVYAVCQELINVIHPGGFCLFHDFNDTRNKFGVDPDYGVYQAVIDGLDENVFEFYGVYGCTALYRLYEWLEK